jgi:hypothetical protein
MPVMPCLPVIAENERRALVEAARSGLLARGSGAVQAIPQSAAVTSKARVLPSEVRYR